MSQSHAKYYSMDLRDLRKECLAKKLPDITKTSNRQQCINALMKDALKSPSIGSRRPSLSNGATRNRRRAASHSRSPKFSRIQATQTRPKRKSRKRGRDALDQENFNNNQLSHTNQQRRRKRRKTYSPSTSSVCVHPPSYILPSLFVDVIFDVILITKILLCQKPQRKREI